MPLDEVARLSRLEELVDRQLADSAAMSKQLEKLQLRARLTSSELKKPLEKVGPGMGCGGVCCRDRPAAVVLLAVGSATT